MSFSAVIFDFFGTLTPSTPAGIWDEHAARSASPLGIPMQQWRRALDESFPERATGALGDLSQTIRTLAQRCGIDPDDDALAAATAARLASQRELFVFRDDALDALEQLRSRGLRIGVLSDCTIELAETWPTLAIAPLVDAVVLSCQEGRRKPDPELFRQVARELETPTSECLYVGDGGGNELSGAAGQGMTAVMLRESDWADNDAHAREDSWPGPFLTTLSNVVSAVGDPPLITA
ncbi:HAD family hydrolase [Streptomyces sp. NPDC059766]|uniref:HAD family hydrolase n=1 Tax=Streptomyces sp. NPDC059766 TaxID=3346940 RepID=UPI0036489E3F